MTYSTDHQLDLFRGLDSATLERRRGRTKRPANSRPSAQRVETHGIELTRVPDLDRYQVAHPDPSDEHRHGRGRLANPQHLPVRRVGPARQMSQSLYTFKGLDVDQREKPCRAAAPIRVPVRAVARKGTRGRLQSTPAWVAPAPTAPRRESFPSAALSYLFVAVTLACTFLV